MGMEPLRRTWRDSDNRLNWPACVLAIALVIYGIYELAETHVSLHGLPPIEERISRIRKAVDPDDFCFALLGDSKNDKEVFPGFMTEIENDPEIAFVIHLGDIVTAPYKVFYQDFLETLGMHLNKPIIIVPGNHEGGGPNGGHLFDQTIGPRHYAFQIGATNFVIADTQRLATAEEQNWLGNALNRENGVQSIVFMHTPLYDPRSGVKPHCLDPQTAGELNAIFIEYHVKHIFTGHLHGYWTGQWGGVPYSITAGAGGSLYSRDPDHGFYHYLKVRVRDGRIGELAVPANETFFSKAMSTTFTWVRVEFQESILLAAIVFSGLASMWRWFGWHRRHRSMGR